MTDRAFEITEYDFSESGLAYIEANYYAKNYWPLVYILSCSKKSQAYVGESADACTRMATHLKDDAKTSLKDIHFITSTKFNKSAALDIESNLIRYMAADGQFDLLNGNLGLANHNYYQKAEVYWGIFTRVWDDLRSKGVVKSSLESINNSDVFKYSPYKSLSTEQEQGLQAILRSLLDDSANRVLVEGGAGTGKTILAIFLFKILASEQSIVNDPEQGTNLSILQGLVDKVKAKYPNPSMALVVPMSSFRKTLQKVFRNIKGLNAKMVIGPSDVAKKEYDLLVVDESHRLKRRVNLTNYASFDNACEKLGFDKYTSNELDWILKQSKKFILFYDQDQSIKPSDIPSDIFKSLKADSRTHVEELKSQFRVQGGNAYVNFVDRLLNQSLQEQTIYQSKKYELLLFDSLESMINKIKQRDSYYGLSRLIAGFSWEWKSKNKKGDIFDIEIGDVKLKWNSTPKDWINSKEAIKEVGCIHTTQGYDLNYSGIIFGHEIGYDPITKDIVIHKDKYFDKNGKNSIKAPEELKAYILNIYKTILLRGIRGTYIYACDPHLRNYLAQYIPLANPTTATAENNIEKLPIDQVRPFENAIPFYGLDAAAGGFSEDQTVEDIDWIALPEGLKPSKDLFACRVVGESMNRVIPNGSICLFKKDPGGSRNGKIVLVEHTDITDVDTGSCYTVKEYRSQKVQEDGSWRHESICLKPVSNDSNYQELILTGDQVDGFRVVGCFEGVLG